ncbi:glycosyltransferase [Candidatus Parcubacteria bacterium]|nr:glycosyltransferase [Candidatus Parcubacteria bacterium]
MKLLYIVNARIPTEKAHGYQICKMCEEFSAAGVEVELWAPTRENLIKKNTFDFYNLKENFKIKYIKSFDFIKYDKLLLKKSVYLQSLWFFLKLAFKKFDKNILVYTRNPELVWLFNLRGVKTVYECHDWFGKKKKIALMCLRKCGYIITTNNYIKKEFVKRGFEKNILVSPNGVNLEIFNIDISKKEAIKKLDINEGLRRKISNKKILLYTGSFRTMGVDKGIDEILQALKKLNNKNIFFVAVGGNEKDIAYYENFAKDIGVAERCEFINRRAQTDLALWQKASDILLMPFPDKAHYRYFMTPLKIFEYMAACRSIIASNLPSIREILNNKNCVFCAPGDFGDLAKKIEFIFEYEDFGKKISRQAREDIKRYTWKNRTRQIINFLKN